MREIRFAFVGFGNIAKTHMVALRALPIVKQLPVLPVLDTLITRNPDANRSQAEAIGFRHIGASLEQALADRELHVVDICTPNALHPEAAFPALQAGTTLYCEKPLTDRYARSKQLAAAAGTSGQHQVALVYRYHPAVLRIREALRQGVIGDVVQCRCAYRRSGYLNDTRPLSWRLSDTLSGGGAITDLGVHVLDTLRHLFGEIERVDGRTATLIKERPLEGKPDSRASVHVDDWAELQVRHAGGLVTVGEVSRVAWGFEAFQLDIVGTKGAISCDLEKEYTPRIKLLNGTTPLCPQPTALRLLTDDKSTLGMSVDCHFGSLHHFLLRLAGEDPYEAGLAPTFQDALEAERWVDHVIRQNGGLTDA